MPPRRNPKGSRANSGQARASDNAAAATMLVTESMAAAGASAAVTRARHPTPTAIADSVESSRSGGGSRGGDRPIRYSGGSTTDGVEVGRAAGSAGDGRGRSRSGGRSRGRGGRGRSSGGGTRDGVEKSQASGNAGGHGEEQGRSEGSARGRKKRGRSNSRSRQGSERPHRPGAAADVARASSLLSSGESDGDRLDSVSLDHLPAFQLTLNASGCVVKAIIPRRRSSRHLPILHLTPLSRAIESLGGELNLAVVRFMKQSDLPNLEPTHVNCVIINDEPYSFLCATDEQQLKGEPEALFFKGSPQEAEQALARLGDYSACKTAAKMSRRLRLAFWHGAFYLPPLDKTQLVDISDIERHNYWCVNQIWPSISPLCCFSFSL